MVKRKKNSFGAVFNMFFLIVISLILLVPILNILAKSLTSAERIGELSGLSVLPKGFTLTNYQVLFSNPQVVKAILISVFLTVFGTVLSLFLTAITAYALTRPGFVGKKIYMLILITFMVFEPGLVQEYFVVQKLGLLNSLWSVILYRTIDVYYLIILMRFFEEVPTSITEAASIDGAGHFTQFTRVVLPLSKSAMATMGLFYGVYRWNEYFRASIYINDPAKWPLQVLMRQFVVLNDNSAMLNTSGTLSAEVLKNVDFNALKAGTIMISIIPLILIYPFILRFFTEGTMDGGVKE